MRLAIRPTVAVVDPFEDAVALMYANGSGVPQDHAEAAKWFRKAADQGLAEAQFNLGRMYASGSGVRKDDIRALAWLDLAAAQGLQGASEAAQVVASRMMPVWIAEAKWLARELTPRIDDDEGRGGLD